MRSLRTLLLPEGPRCLAVVEMEHGPLAVHRPEQPVHPLVGVARRGRSGGLAIRLEVAQAEVAEVPEEGLTARRLPVLRQSGPRRIELVRPELDEDDSGLRLRKLDARHGAQRTIITGQGAFSATRSAVEPSRWSRRKWPRCPSTTRS